MKKTLVLIALTSLFSLACGESAPDQANVNEGKEIYEKYCVACHGKNGELALNGAKKFPESTLGVEERVLVISNGRNMMTPFKEILTKEEIDAVAAYTMILSKKE